MAMQSPDALQQHVSGAKVGDEQVGVDVQRLLQRLRAHHHQPAGGPSPPQSPLNLLIQQLAVNSRETSVVQRGYDRPRRTAGQRPAGR